MTPSNKRKHLICNRTTGSPAPQTQQDALHCSPISFFSLYSFLVIFQLCVEILQPFIATHWKVCEVFRLSPSLCNKTALTNISPHCLWFWFFLAFTHNKCMTYGGNQLFDFTCRFHTHNRRIRLQLLFLFTFCIMYDFTAGFNFCVFKH